MRGCGSSSGSGLVWSGPVRSVGSESDRSLDPGIRRPEDGKKKVVGFVWVGPACQCPLAEYPAVVFIV